MLVLARRVGEWVVIPLPDGRRIRIQVTKSERGMVRLGFEAPDDIEINREEVQDRIDAERAG